MVRRFLRSSDAVLVLFLFVLVAAIVYATRDYPSVPWEDGGSPAFFPLFLATLLGGLACAAALEGLRDPVALTKPERAGALRIAAALGVLAVAPHMLGWLGFRVTSALLGLAMMFISVGPRGLTAAKVAIMLATAIGVALLLGFAFEDVAGRRLPRMRAF